MIHTIDVSVLGGTKSSKKNLYRLKVSIHDLGIHIMGIIVQDSIIEGEKYYVTTPAHKVGAKYYKDITFETSKELWLEIQSACIQTIEDYTESPLTDDNASEIGGVERVWK
jgi:DNA-binding cell septation regulator SpoVG